MNIRLRTKRAAECFQNASLSLGRIEKGFSLFGLTRGQFSMIDLILACLDQCGPSRVSLWTWCIAEYEVQVFNRLMMDNRIGSGLLVIDSRARSREDDHARGVLRKWQEVHGADSIKFVVNHAKIATIESAEFQLLLRGSMNLNFNPRFEQFDVDEGHPGFDVVRQTERELPILRFDHERSEAMAISQVDKCFTQDELRIFETPKAWAK